MWFALLQAHERLSDKQYALESKTQQKTELADQVGKLSESLREARVHKDDLEMQLGKLRTQSVQLEEKLAGKDDEIKNLATTVKKIQAYNLELKDSADKSATSAQQAQTRQLEAEVQRLTAQLAEATATKGAAMNAQLDQAAAVQLSSIESLHRKQRQTAEREFMEQFEKLETQLKTTKTRLRETENEVARTQADKNQLLRTIGEECSA